jgi:4-alpha-glucanotransferase
MVDSSRQLDFRPFPPEYRASGVLLHVTSLPSSFGIGDLGPAAMRWIDLLHEAGQSWWQSLPLGPTGYGNSPYQSLSSFAANELLVSPDWLIEDGLLRATDCVVAASSETTVDYRTVIQFKQWILDEVWNNFSSAPHPALKAAFEEFCQDQSHWLEDYALFCAL